MFIITFKAKGNNIDKKIEDLQINDIFNVYYESALNILKDNWGYGYEEKQEEILDLNIVYDDDKNLLDNFIQKLTNILDDDNYTVREENYDYTEVEFPAVEIDDTWVLANPNEEFEGKKKINFISQGAFGTGLHETTKDLLKLILSRDFTNKKVMDIGTGSGILAIATAIKDAQKVTAIDIRDVRDEVELNSSLNNLDTIEVKVGNALNNEFEVDPLYDWIYINIGGEETQMFLDYINLHLKKDGKLLVSGLVEWSFNFVKSEVEKAGYKMIEKLQTNEWCTAIFDKI